MSSLTTSSAFSDLTEAVLGAELSLANKPVFPAAMPAVTLSREAGAGARSVAEALVREFNSNGPVSEEHNWQLFEGELIEHVIRNNGLPKDIARFFREDGPRTLREGLGHALGLHPPVERMVQDTNRGLRALARSGGCVLIGRGGSVATRSLSNVVHVRLVGSLSQRIARTQLRMGVTFEQAEEWVHREDAARRAYVRTWFQEEVDDPSGYDVVINTDRVPADGAARIIAAVVRERRV